MCEYEGCWLLVEPVELARYLEDEASEDGDLLHNDRAWRELLLRPTRFETKLRTAERRKTAPALLWRGDWRHLMRREL